MPRPIHQAMMRHFNSAAIMRHNPLGIPPQKKALISRGLPVARQIPGVKHIVCVASGKGGVGKSTTAVNLSVAFAGMGIRTGLLDADVFGPSIPKLMLLESENEPDLNQRDMLVPLSNYGVKCMSIGFLVGHEAPVVWRGLMVMKAIQQLLWQVDWGYLDVLVVDMPPGTGDVQLTICQQVVISGVVIISTPQDVALIDAVKGVNMFKKVNVPVLGLVQNMSFFTCSGCGKETHIFGDDGVSRKAAEMSLERLADIPLHEDICTTSDKGTPITIADPTSTHARIYKELAKKIWSKIEV